MKKRTNPKIILTSLIALLFIILTFTANWLFIIPAALISWFNWKLLNKKIKA